MRSLITLALWLVPCALAAFPNDEYSRARSLLLRTVERLTPPTDVTFDFTQTSKWLGHRARPWMTWSRQIAGSFMLADGANSFFQFDSLNNGRAVYSSFKFCCDTTLVAFDYGETTPDKLTVDDKRDFVYDLAQLTPLFLLKDFLSRPGDATFLRHTTGPVDSIVYASDNKVVTVAIDAEKLELRSITILSTDDMYGDVARTISFDGYTSTGRFAYPSKIVESVLGFDASVVSVSPSSGTFDRERILGMIPASYRLEPTSPPAAPEIVRSGYNDRIHFLDLKHTRERSLLVEFNDFVLVAEAPLAPSNGEMILAEAAKLAPGKPVRYFVFGHHHPHYLGGMRAFVHKGATILTTALDTTYLRQLVSFPRKLQPDSLALQPRPLKMEIVDGERVVGDGDLEMRIIHIGMMSAHTEDFMIYYFPRHKLLFQDDLAGIPDGTPIVAASDRQKGLYDAIKKHGLDVETIVQGWPIGMQGYKSIFTFDELEQSVRLMK